MQFATSLFSLIASAAVASTASVTFWNLDDTSRTIYFTGNPGSEPIAPVLVGGHEKQKVSFPDVYIGNFYSVKQGEPNVPGMLGELSFGGWNGLTYFDVSAIINPNDSDNVKQMWPASGETPISGCHVFPCNKAYYHPVDIQTQTTPEVDLMCSLGSGVTGLDFLDN